MNVMRNLFKVMLLSAALAVFGCSLTGLARTVSVGVANGNVLSFFPATTNIATDDSVLWTWNSTGITPHSTTSDTNGLWDSTSVPAPHTFTQTFTSAGTFPYHCTIHVTLGMKGTIIVAAANLPPAVTITNPVSGTIFAAPANVTIQASASDSDGTVTNVQFLVGSTVLSNDAAAPFSAVTNNLAAGSYTLSAIASDNNGEDHKCSHDQCRQPGAGPAQCPAGTASRELSFQLHGERRAALHRSTITQFDLDQLDHNHHQHGGKQPGDFHGHKRDGQSGILSCRTPPESVIRCFVTSGRWGDWSETGNHG